MTTLNLQVGTGADDGYWQSGGWNNNGLSVFLGDASGDGTAKSWLRFTGVTIPKNATITSAVLTLQASGNYSATTVNALIKAFAADNPTAPTSEGDANGRALTTASAAWNGIGAWATGTNYNSVGLANVIQEIVNRSGWSSGNALVVVVADSGSTSTASRGAVTYDNNTTYAPKLSITYSPANTAPTITAGPTTTYAVGSDTRPGNTWGVTFTPHDAEQTGANALTYYIRTSATWGAGTQVATGTCTSDSSKVLTGLAYDASGLVQGTNTLYLHLYDGTDHTASASSFSLEVEHVHTGTLAATFPKLGFQATGTEIYTGTLSSTFPHLGFQATGSTYINGVLAVTFPHITFQAQFNKAKYRGSYVPVIALKGSYEPVIALRGSVR